MTETQEEKMRTKFEASITARFGEGNLTLAPSKLLNGITYWTYRPDIQIRWEEWQAATVAIEAKHTDTLQATIGAYEEKIESMLGECRDLGAEWEKISKKRSAQKLELDAEIESLRDRCAMLANELSGCVKIIWIAVASPGGLEYANLECRDGSLINISGALLSARNMLSASAADVEAWKNGQTEPLRREVATLRGALRAIIPIAEKYESTYGFNVEAIVGCDYARSKYAREVLDNTQATAEAYEREVMARALEEAALVADKELPISREEAPRHWEAYEKAWGIRELVAISIAKELRRMAAQLRSK